MVFFNFSSLYSAEHALWSIGIFSHLKMLKTTPLLRIDLHILCLFIFIPFFPYNNLEILIYIIVECVCFSYKRPYKLAPHQHTSIFCVVSSSFILYLMNRHYEQKVPKLSCFGSYFIQVAHPMNPTRKPHFGSSKNVPAFLSQIKLSLSTI